MSIPLLKTKLTLPPRRQNLVPRPLLLQKLDRGLARGHTVTLVSAPAGFGKTTVLRDWADAWLADDTQAGPDANRLAWLSLDERDNDLARFLTYFTAALSQTQGDSKSVGSGAFAMLHAARPPGPEEVLTALINDLTPRDGTLLFVLDDYHLIDNPAVDAALTFFLENMPSGIHLVIATRMDPNLPVARRRAQGRLTELRAADLRFTPDEAADFLNRVMGLSLAAEDIRTLESRTEGWIAGLQLAAISLQIHGDPAQFINSFSGSHRFVMDYLLQDVLAHQTPEVQTFLLQTSVLDRLSGPLCNALTGREDGQAMLESLERANLFLVRLDEERRWYRYHHLLADMLRRRLRQSEPASEARLHSRAAVWFAANGSVDEAIEHALEAQDFERATALVAAVAEDFRQRGEYTKVRHWLRRLPAAAGEAHPELAVYIADGLIVGGQPAAAEQILQAAEEALGAGAASASLSGASAKEAPSGALGQALGRIATMRALMAFYRGDVPAILQHAGAALELMPQEDAGWRSSAAQAIGDAHIVQGDLRAAQPAQERALAVTLAAGNLYMILIANLKLAVTLRLRGRLARAVAICRAQLQLAEEHGLAQTGVAAWAWAIWGEALAELDDLEPALRQASRAVGIFRRLGNAGDIAIRAWSYLCLLRVLYSGRDLAAAGKLIGELEQIARETFVPPWIAAMLAPWQARIWLAEGRLPDAVQWVRMREVQADAAVTFSSEPELVLLARVLSAQGKPEAAAPLLGRLFEAAQAGGRTWRTIEILSLRALAAQAAGQTDRALLSLRQAFALAEPEGCVRSFVDEGPPMARLLQTALDAGLAPAYTQRLLAAFASDGGSQPGPTPLPDQADLVETLSERELEVLAQIAAGLTNQEIADRLFLSLNTVKVHTRNIYGKLGVHSRTQAVARAAELGLLPPH